MSGVELSGVEWGAKAPRWTLGKPRLAGFLPGTQVFESADGLVLGLRNFKLQFFSACPDVLAQGG